MKSTRPTLLHSCAKAATAAEARFRIDGPTHTPRAARIVALDPGADAVIREAANEEWEDARFFAHRESRWDSESGNGELTQASAPLSPAGLPDGLADADVVVMVATGNKGAAAAAELAAACRESGIMTAGLVLGQGETVREAANALRPYAQVLLVTADISDLAAVLTALRA